MSDEPGQSKNIGRRRLLQMLTAGGGLAAAGLVPKAWASPSADVLEAAAAGRQPAPSPSATPPPTTSPSPSVLVSVSTSPPPPTPAPPDAAPVVATPPFTG